MKKLVLCLFIFVIIVTSTAYCEGWDVFNLFGSDDSDKKANLNTKELYKQSVGSVVALTVTNSKGGCIGTGFYALEPDIIVTCYHVVEGATNIIAKNNNGNIVSIDGIIDYSQEKDIALLKASSKNSTFLELQANMPKPGTPAYVLGSPKGLDFSFSNGMVSQIRRGKETLIQFTCPVSPGNSGGPLLAEDGKVLGIVSCQLTEGQNLNFAVPSASLYMLNKDNAVTIVKNSTSISNNQEFKSNEHFIYGKKYLEAGLYSEAISEFVEVLKVFPESLEVYSCICFCLLNTKEYEHLKKIANEAIKISINSNNKSFLVLFYACLGEAYRDGDGENEKAIKYYKLALDENVDSSLESLNCQIGDCYLSLNDKSFSENHYYIKQAIIYYEKALKINSKNYRAAYGLGRCYHYLNEYKKSNQYHELALNNDTEKTIYTSILWELAFNYQFMGDYNQAISYHQKRLTVEPDSEGTIEGIGDCYVGLKEYRKAIDYYQKALDIPKVLGDNKREIIHYNYNIANCYCDLHEYNKAISYYKKVLAVEPDYDPALRRIGDCYVGLKNYRKAIDYYQKALDKAKKDTRITLDTIGLIYYSIGECYYKLHDYNKAIDFLQKTLKNIPDLKRAKELLEDCKKQLRKK